MRNPVSRHDFNRASAHKSEKDYTRISKQELLELVEKDWYEDLIPDEINLPLKDPEKWEVSNTKYYR